jgi:hypothetical protein
MKVGVQVKAQTPLTPALLVATASAFVALGENRGDASASAGGGLVHCFLRSTGSRRGERAGSARVPWNVAFVNHAGYWSHYEEEVERSSWPLPEAGTVGELAQYAGTTGALRESPLDGDLFLQWSRASRAFVHVGVIVRVKRFSYEPDGVRFFDCITVEAPADRTAGKARTRPLRCHRHFAPARGDRFIRWSSLDGREERREAIEKALDFKARIAAA